MSTTTSPEVLHTRLPRGPDGDDSDNDLELGELEASPGAPGVALWTLWPGNNKFYCDGRIMAGPENVPFSVTCGLMTVPVLLYLGFVVPGLVSRNGGFIWCALLAVVGLGSMLGTLTVCHTTDPGIIPREPTPEKRPPRILNKKLADNSIERWRWCDTCNVYRPPRCHHCSDCDNCVDGFDHHCPWVGNCIAARNYKYFFFFLISTSLMLAFVFGTSLYYFMIIKTDSDDIGETIANAPVALGLMIYCGVVFLPVMCLASYHCNIISSGQTTKEEVKQLHQDSVNLNDHGCCTNWKLTLCGKLTPSKLPELRDMVHQRNWCNEEDPEEEEHSLMSSSGREGASIEMNAISTPSPPPYGDDHVVDEVSVSPFKSPTSGSRPSRPSPIQLDSETPAPKPDFQSPGLEAPV
eukprot:TRINITY_DN5087_c0_g1_i1.p1 TRINITY_DN5087_c0_g1~~TRINITY_DN5087_c0_g1_i1.p1  ORF type:complete len:408 (-),score=72.21 TRINITY_DN5087_c0_g1_i1:257-1480(-)